MLVFAWILWGIFTFCYGVVLIAAIVITACDKWDEVNLKIGGIGFFVDIAMYVFLNLYLFMR